MVAALGASSCRSPQLLGRQIGLSEDHASGIASWPVETGDQPGSDRIETHSEDDRNRGGCRFYTQCCNSVRNDHGRPSADEFCRHPWNPIILIVSPAILDSDVLALDESGLVQALSERTDKRLGAGRRRGAEETDHRHRRLLRPHRKRTTPQRYGRIQLRELGRISAHCFRLLRCGPDRRELIGGQRLAGK